MSVFVRGWGAVSPAGWGAEHLVSGVVAGVPLPTELQEHPGFAKGLPVRRVPIPNPRPAELAHARLRRTSPIGQYACAAAMEALAGHRGDIGVVYCTLSGCVNYSRRFYAEVLSNPPTASPLLFPETVANSPASHISAVLGSTALNYTLVGDQTCLLQGLAIAAEWLEENRMAGCVVIGAEELDWLITGGNAVFRGRLPVSEGAGAIYLSKEKSAIRLESITQGGADGLPHLKVNGIMGEGFLASAMWHLIVALALLNSSASQAADVLITGTSGAMGGVRFGKEVTHSV